MEPTIINDFGFTEKNLLSNLLALKEYEPELDCSNIAYSTIFDESALKKICDEKFQAGIKEYVMASDEIYESFEYLEKGKLTLPKLKDLKKSLIKDAFFTRDNRVVLSGQKDIENSEDLEREILDIETKIQQMPAYQAIEKLLSDVKGSLLKDIIETHPEIIEYLDVDKLPTLKKCMWASYINSNKALFNELYEKYSEFSDAMDHLELDDTPWKRALDIFKQRFSVPFSMEINNLKGAIIGESVPQVQFSFRKGDNVKTINRSELERLDTLSQGEKRALYLLNIIFDIEQLKAAGKEVVLIVDDIADSFDYKNKYAIVEYLYEISREPNFYMLILSHNFDFYRTVASRLSIMRDKRLMAERSNNSLTLEVEKYQGRPSKNWKSKPEKKRIWALLPFVRNLIEFGVDDWISGGEDYLVLTSLLHEKDESSEIKFSDVKPLYERYAGVKSFADTVDMNEKVLNTLFPICDSITEEDSALENKIVLAIGIRHKAEQYMIERIKTYEGQLLWEKRRNRQQVSGERYLELAEENSNQIRELLAGFKQFGTDEEIQILNEVSIMTPEHIHINSFMYEPILDMDIVELHKLYQDVKELADS